MTRAFHQILGSCLVVSAAGAQTAIYTIEAPDSPTAPHAFGASVDGVGDMDGDGLAEFLYAAPFYDPGGAFGSGLVVVASGASGLPLHELVGATGAGIGTRAGRAPRSRCTARLRVRRAGAHRRSSRASRCGAPARTPRRRAAHRRTSRPRRPRRTGGRARSWSYRRGDRPRRRGRSGR